MPFWVKIHLVEVQVWTIMRCLCNGLGYKSKCCAKFDSQFDSTHELYICRKSLKKGLEMFST
jgi:hypothetical protein